MDLSATVTGLDVQATWNPAATSATVDSYEVLRGATQETLEAVAQVPASQTSYVDTAAATTGEAVWYQVKALDDQGDVLEASQPTMVEIA